LIVAGEASADAHSALVMKRISDNVKINLCGIGGHHLKALGLQPIATPEDMGVIGLVEAVGKIAQALRLISQAEKLAKDNKPDFAFLVDLPDFNLRLATRLKKLKIPIIYYISPQVWAWRSYRVEQMSKNIDILFSIFPFEKKWFDGHANSKLNVQYVGHPLLEEIADQPYSPDENTIALLPGSRKSEVSRILPEIIRATVLLKKQFPKLKFIIPVAEPLRAEADSLFKSAKSILKDDLTLQFIPSQEVLRKAKLAIVSSGTATLETAIVGTPMVVVYRVSPISAFLFKYFIGYSGPISMANIIHCGLNSKFHLVPELIQGDCTAVKIVKEVTNLILNKENWQKQADTLCKTRELLVVQKYAESEGKNTLKHHSQIIANKILHFCKDSTLEK